MTKTLKIVLISLGTILILIVIGFFIAESILHSKVENLLKNGLPETLKVEYEELDINTFEGNLTLKNAIITNYGQTTKEVNAKLLLDELVVEDFGYWKYLNDDLIIVENIKLQHPVFTYYHNSQIPPEEQKYSKLETLKQNVRIDNFDVINGELTVKDATNDSLIMSLKDFNSRMDTLRLNPETVKLKIPFTYANYEVDFDNLYYRVSDYDDVRIQQMAISKAETVMDSVTLKTKYSKSQYSKLLEKERDHFDLSIAQIKFEKLEFGYEKDTTFTFKTPLLNISSPKLYIYRDKQVADDTTIKPLYSEMLRNLNFDLSLEKILIDNGIVQYTEKIDTGEVVDAVNYSDLHANIQNLGNTFDAPVNIAITSNFMESTPVEVNWNFDIRDEKDQFEFKAEIGRLDASRMNEFSEPTMNVKLEGALHKTYFTINGQTTSAHVDLKINYDDFKVIIMQKDENKKNTVMTAIANIFIKKDSDAIEGDYRNGSATVQRNMTKSVFNQLWITLSGGLKDALTGKGDRKKK